MMAAQFLSAFTLSFLTTPILRGIARRLNLLDVPNERSSHGTPTPRTGGYAILAGITLVVSVWGGGGGAFVTLLAAALVVAITGAIDDVVDLREWQKLLIQVGAASLLVIHGSQVVSRMVLPSSGSFSLGSLSVLITLVWLVGFTNAFNFMDGINGIASSQAILAGLTYTVLFWREGDSSAVALSLAIAGAAAGFLPWNLPRGSIFMGDVGSATLGFLLAGLVVRYSQNGGSFLVAVLPLLPFVMDTGTTLVRRILRGEQFLSAHRSHFYQRLNQLGWEHWQVTMLWAFLIAGFGCLSLNWNKIPENARVLWFSVALGTMGAVLLSISFAERRTDANSR